MIIRLHNEVKSQLIAIGLSKAVHRVHEYANLDHSSSMHLAGTGVNCSQKSNGFVCMGDLDSRQLEIKHVNAMLV